MSAQKKGWDYLQSYPGILNISEVAVNTVILIFGIICEFTLKMSIISFLASYGIFSTLFFFTIHVKAIIHKSELPWNWIECTHSLIMVILYTLASSIVISELTKAFIVTGITGFICTMVYILDTIDKYHTAVTPRARYVWTTPNMPE